MKKLLFLVPLIVAAIACTNETVANTLVPIMGTELSRITETPVSVTVTNSPVPTNTATATITTTPPAAQGGELMRNRSFEIWATEAELREDVNMPKVYHPTPVDWIVWHGSLTYLSTPLPAIYRCHTDNNDPTFVPDPGCDLIDGTGNDWSLTVGRQEVKKSDITGGPYARVNSGNYAAQAFWFARPAFGGFQQEIWLPSRNFATQCTFSMYFQTWISDGTTGLNSLPIQPNATHDDKLALTASMHITDGLMLRDGTTILAQQLFAHDALTYDKYARYDMVFSLPAHIDKIYAVLGVRTAWPWNTQNFYWDDVSLRCNGLNFEPATPMPTPTANIDNGATSVAPTPFEVTPIFQPDAYLVLPPADFLAFSTRNIRSRPVVDPSTLTGGLLYAGKWVKIYMRYDDPSSDDFWGCLHLDETSYICSGENNCDLVCYDWVAIKFNGSYVGQYKENFQNE